MADTETMIHKGVVENAYALVKPPIPLPEAEAGAVFFCPSSIHLVGANVAVLWTLQRTSDRLMWTIQRSEGAANLGKERKALWTQRNRKCCKGRWT